MKPCLPLFPPSPFSDLLAGLLAWGPMPCPHSANRAETPEIILPFAALVKVADGLVDPIHSRQPEWKRSRPFVCESDRA